MCIELSPSTATAILPGGERELLFLLPVCSCQFEDTVGGSMTNVKADEKNPMSAENAKLSLHPIKNFSTFCPEMKEIMESWP